MKKLPGVERVVVSLELLNAVVDYDETKVTADVIVSAIEAARFDAELLADRDVSTPVAVFSLTILP